VGTVGKDALSAGAARFQGRPRGVRIAAHRPASCSSPKPTNRGTRSAIDPRMWARLAPCSVVISASSRALGSPRLSSCSVIWRRVVQWVRWWRHASSSARSGCASRLSIQARRAGGATTRGGLVRQARVRSRCECQGENQQKRSRENPQKGSSESSIRRGGPRGRAGAAAGVGMGPAITTSPDAAWRPSAGSSRRSG
jgi:hypothetical protein